MAAGEYSSSRSNSRYLLTTVVPVSVLSAYAWHVWPIRYSVSDAVAQFLPVSLDGYRALKAGNLPLFNFYQYMGHPVLEMAYFPVLYPLFFIACLISEHFLKDQQLAWDVLGSLQTIATGLASFLFFDRVLKLQSAVLSVLGAVTLSFVGNNLYMRGEFFYGTVTYTFVPLLLVCLHSLLTSKNLFNAIWFALAAYFFVTCSNIQYLFYSVHLLLFGLWIIISKIEVPLWSLVKRQWQPLTLAAALTVLLLIPYLYGMAEFQADSSRETTTVPLEQYFWTASDPISTWTFMALPFTGETEPSAFYQVPYSFYCGPLSFIGVLLAPFLWLWARKKNRKDIARVIGPLVIALTLFFLLSIGKKGGLGLLLYHLPPYNWFRHSTKWIPFFQMSVVYLAFVVWDAIFENFFRNRRLRNALLVFLSVLTLSCTAWAITISQTPKRLTEVEVPLPKPALALDSTYRHLGIWSNIEPNGGEYRTDVPARLLCFNFGSYWELPMAAGYEPRAWKNNLNLAKGNWFPGCYRDYKDVDLAHFNQWSARYIRIPNEDAEKALTYLKTKFPELALSILGVDPVLNVTVIENKSAPPLVFSDSASVRRFKIESGGRVVARIKAAKPGAITFAWAYNPYMTARVDGRHAKATPDPEGRIQVMVQAPGHHTVEIGYAPKLLLRLYKVCSLAFLIIAAGAVLLPKIFIKLNCVPSNLSR